MLHNKVDKEILKKRLMEEAFKRITLSMYRYIHIDDPKAYRDQLYLNWEKLSVFGRIYVANEGINAQLSVPEHYFEAFKESLETDPILAGIRLNIAVEDDGKSFYKLAIKTREKIVADGLDDSTFDPGDVGTHLDAAEFNKIIEQPDTVLVDMRNHYESEVGHFENAICPDADTFRQELPMVLDILHDKKDKPVVLYCTGGIRCEKASAFLKHHGFKNVSQLQGGIIHYARQVKSQGLPNKFRGKNFVFDERLGERIGDEIISHCHQCGELADTHTNCANPECHLLFIQCEACAEKFEGCCTLRCQEIIHLPEEEQKKIRKASLKEDARMVYKSRLRPNLSKITRG